jgi:protein involved in polysaccharide export with SLBB domain
MSRKSIIVTVFSLFLVNSVASGAESFSNTLPPSTISVSAVKTQNADYQVDNNDIITVAVIQPDPFNVELTVSPDGTVTFPYIGSILVKGLTIIQIQEKIQTGLLDYMKYPLVAVSLKETRSSLQQFYVFGEVQRPGTYPLERDTTVLRAITTAGGFTRVASTSNVKLVRQNTDGSTQSITIDISALMSGKKTKDEKVQHGDVITVSQRFF